MIVKQSSSIFSRPLFKYLILFIGTYHILAGFIIYAPSVSHHFTFQVTNIATTVLKGLGFTAEIYPQVSHVEYTEIRFESTIYRVNEECTGLYLIMLVIAAVVAVPTALPIRIFGIILTGFIAACIGCVRIVILGCIAEYQAHIFHLFHTYLMEVATIGICAVILSVWCNFTLPYRKSTVREC